MRKQGVIHNGNGSVELHVLQPYDVHFLSPDLLQILHCWGLESLSGKCWTSLVRDGGPSIEDRPLLRDLREQWQESNFKMKALLIYWWALLSLCLKNMCIDNANINNKIEQSMPPFNRFSTTWIHFSLCISHINTTHIIIDYITLRIVGKLPWNLSHLCFYTSPHFVLWTKK